MSSKEKNSRRVMIITIITSIIVILGTVSYAFYQTAINGAVSGTIAKWSFTANNQTDSFDLNLGELYPGKSGTYNITLSAVNSDLDVYYELIFTSAASVRINEFLYWDSNYTKPLAGTNSYVGRYGVITKSSSVTIPLYLNWPYDSVYNDGIDYFYDNDSWYMPEIKIIAKQYTGYSGSIPMNLFGFTNLVSYNNSENNIVIPTIDVPAQDKYGYFETNEYKFETINATSGYILNGSFS